MWFVLELRPLDQERGLHNARCRGTTSAHRENMSSAAQQGDQEQSREAVSPKDVVVGRFELIAEQAIRVLPETAHQPTQQP